MSFQDYVDPVQTHSYPALGFDPAPGDVRKIAGMAAHLEHVATELGHANTALTTVGQSDSVWEGEAATKFHETIGELPGYLDKADRSLGDASSALAGWSTDLANLQAKAQEYERLAAQARQDVQSAESNPNLGLVDQTFSDDASLAQAQQAYDGAKTTLSNARGDLDEIIEQAQRLKGQHLELAGKVENALRDAKDEAPEEPGFFDRIGEMFNDLVEGIGNFAKKAWKWVEDHADLIAKIGDVLSDIGTVLSIVAAATSWIPVVGEITMAAAVGVSGLAMGAHLLAKAAGANVSWSTIAFDGLGMIPGAGAGKGAIGAAKVLPRVAKSAKGAMAVAEDGSKLAAGVKAASTAFSRSGAQELGKYAHYADKGLGFGAKLIGKGEQYGGLALNSWETGGKTLLRTTEVLHTAQSGAAVVAGTTLLTGKVAAVQVGKWEAQPYIEQGKESIMNGFDNAVGRR